AAGGRAGRGRREVQYQNGIGPTEDDASATPSGRIRVCGLYWDRASAEADKHHRPRERRAHLLDGPVLREQGVEADLRPVVQVAGRVPEVEQVGAASH